MKKVSVFLAMVSIALSVNLWADAKGEKAITSFLARSIAEDAAHMPTKKITLGAVRFVSSGVVDQNWQAYLVGFDVVVVGEDKKKTVFKTNRQLYYSNGVEVRDELNIPQAQGIEQKISPKPSNELYDDKHYVAGNKNAAHKLILFTDPLCPACRKAVPMILNKVQSNPDGYALYIYHYPLERLHPESPAICEAMIALKASGVKDVESKVYKETITSANDLKKLFGGYSTGSNTKKELASDIKWAEKLAVGGTPTLFYDGEIDPFGKKLFSKK